MLVRRGAWLLTCWLAVALALSGCDVLAKAGGSKSSTEDDDGGGKKKKKKKKKKSDEDDEDSDEDDEDSDEDDEDSDEDDDADEDDGGKKVVKVATYEGDDYHWVCGRPGDKKFKLRSFPRSEHEDAVEEAGEMLERLAKLGRVDVPLLRGIEAVGGDVALGMLPDRSKGPYKRNKLVVLIHPKLFDVMRKANEPQAAFLLSHQLGCHASQSGTKQSGAEVELAADKFAGRILGLEGHSLAQSATWIVTNAPATATRDKADRTKRLEALAEGWRSGCKTGGKCKDPNEPIPGTKKKKPPKKGGSFSDREGR